MAAAGSLSEAPIRLALFGSPIRHSFSPRIHPVFARQFGLTVDYRAVEVQPGQLAAALQELAAAGGRGCNITTPLKQEAMQLADVCSATVQRAGAANVLLRENGGWQAESTDGSGFIRDLRAWSEISLKGIEVAILGAGGATASILGALLQAEVACVHIYNRSLARAEALAAGHADLGKVFGHGHSDLSAGAAGLVINATPLGHAGQVPTGLEPLLAEGGACYDLNYGVAARPLSAWCAERNIRHRDGLGMLVGQAVDSFYLWTGHTPDAKGVEQMLRVQLA